MYIRRLEVSFEPQDNYHRDLQLLLLARSDVRMNRLRCEEAAGRCIDGGSLLVHDVSERGLGVWGIVQQ